MRQRVHITESQFLRLVENATRQCLTELDWKTYQSAGDKALYFGDKERANKFYHSAAHQFNNDYGVGIKYHPNVHDMGRVKYDDENGSNVPYYSKEPGHYPVDPDDPGRSTWATDGEYEDSSAIKRAGDEIHSYPDYFKKHGDISPETQLKYRKISPIPASAVDKKISNGYFESRLHSKIKNIVREAMKNVENTNYTYSEKEIDYAEEELISKLGGIQYLEERPYVKYGYLFGNSVAPKSGITMDIYIKEPNKTWVNMGDAHSYNGYKDVINTYKRNMVHRPNGMNPNYDPSYY